MQDLFYILLVFGKLPFLEMQKIFQQILYQ